VRKGDRVVLCMQNCPQLVIAHFAILRANAVVVPVNPMNRAEELKHYITDPDAKVAITTGDLASELASGQRCIGPEERLAHLIVTQFTDAFDAGVSGPTRRRTPGATGCGTRHSLPALAGGRRMHGQMRWPALSAPAPNWRRGRRTGAAALHQRHHRPAQGLHAPAREHHAQRVASALWGNAGRPRTSRWRWCRCSTSPAWSA
jgi:fatty-acyl-CoA synthase